MSEQKTKESQQNNELSSEDIKIIKTLAVYLEQIKFSQYVENQTNFRKLLWTNFVVSTVRGFGYIVGATILIAYFWFVINWLGGLPWIGKIVAQIVEVVKQQGV